MSTKGPTRNDSYNARLALWAKETGQPQKASCEECEADLTGRDVFETPAAWLCSECHVRAPQCYSVTKRGADLRYVGNGYAVDSRGNFREAFWAGTR